MNVNTIYFRHILKWNFTYYAMYVHCNANCNMHVHTWILEHKLPKVCHTCMLSLSLLVCPILFVRIVHLIDDMEGEPLIVSISCIIILCLCGIGCDMYICVCAFMYVCETLYIMRYNKGCVHPDIDFPEEIKSDVVCVLQSQPPDNYTSVAIDALSINSQE